MNAIREVCARCPLAMNSDLMQDLAQYKKYRNKAVVASARSLIQLYRSNNPELLHKKDRVSNNCRSYEAVIPVYANDLCCDRVEKDCCI